MRRTEKENNDRTRTYREAERDNDSQFRRSGRRPLLWFRDIMDEEMEFLNNVLHGARMTDRFLPLFTGEAARNSVTTVDVCALSLREDRKVKLSEVMK